MSASIARCGSLINLRCQPLQENESLQSNIFKKHFIYNFKQRFSFKYTLRNLRKIPETQQQHTLKTTLADTQAEK